MAQQDDTAPADRETGLLMRYLPPPARAYAELMRLDRPVGTWLLFWPCLWGMTLALAPLNAYPQPAMIALFAFGALVMRGAGCTINDIIDADIDARVARTAGRPLPSGRVSKRAAFLFLAAQCLIGLVVLLQFNLPTIMLGVASLALITAYPSMKRLTWWPQLFLGLTFNWGALMGYAAIKGEISVAALALYAAGIFWTLGYDTIYAHQDKEDDALIGVKSSALRLGQYSRPAIAVFYALMLACLGLAGSLVQMTIFFWVGLAVTAWHLAMQVYWLDIDDAAQCLKLFRSNRNTGLIVAATLTLGIF